MPNWGFWGRSGDAPRADDWGQRFQDVLVSDATYYDPFRVASARRYWRVQAINSHIVNVLGAAELTAGDGDSGREILQVFENSASDLLPQWGADLQIDANAFGRLEEVKGAIGNAALVRYIAPQTISVMIWGPPGREQVVGYELTPRYGGLETYTSVPVINRPFTGGPNQYPPEEIIHLKNGLDPRYGELLGDNKLRDILEIISIDAELTYYTRDIVRNVASNSFILQPAARDEQGLRMEELRGVLQSAQRALTRLARGGIAMLPGRVDAINVGKNPRDLQFSDLHKDTESAIASAFNVEPILLKWRLGSEHATYSNVREARQEEQENLVFPLAKVLERGINDYFGRRGAAGEVQVRVPKLWTLEQLIALHDAGLDEAANEVADALGLPYPELSGGGQPRLQQQGEPPRLEVVNG